MRSPANWTDALARLAYALGGTGQAVAAEEWLREVIAARYRVESLHALTRPQRQVAFQKVCGVVMMIEEQGEIAFALDVRQLVQAAFARYFQGVIVDGPPWRLTPYEELPTYDEWQASTDFGEKVAVGAGQTAEAVQR